MRVNITLDLPDLPDSMALATAAMLLESYVRENRGAMNGGATYHCERVAAWLRALQRARIAAEQSKP